MSLVYQLGMAVGMQEEKATLLARLLAENDLRGVFSHGTMQMSTYARLMRDGQLNPRPEIQVAQESPSSVLMDGDGGLGYFPSYEGTERLITKAKNQGIAISVTRNHGHFGAAGIYARLTLPHDLLCFVTSGHQLSLHPGHPIMHAAGGSPLCFSAPAQEEDPMILDFGPMHDLYGGNRLWDDIVSHAPSILFRSIGMGAVCQSWGGFLAGVPVDPARAQRTFPGANQGSLVIAFRIDLFSTAEQFKREMDEYIRSIRQMTPVPGYSEALLPGGIEAKRARNYAQEGVPVGDYHRERLETIAKELNLSVPW